MTLSNISAETILEKERACLAPGMQNFAVMANMVVDHAKNDEVFDTTGKRYLDFIGGIGVNSIGHCHPHYVKRLQDQLEKVTLGSFTTTPRADLLEKLAAFTPKPLNRIQLYSSGAEAVESALRLAKSYTKKFEVMSFWGGFHGKTVATMALMGSSGRKGLGPLVGGVLMAPYGMCVSCALNQKHTTCDNNGLNLVRETIEHTSVGALAAIIVEPVQGTAGNIIPSPEWLPGLKSIAREFDALLIADEMITGFGRTGRNYGFEHTDTLPDIITIGKGFGGGFPISGLITTDEICQAKPYALPSGSSSSYGGNPLAATAALATLEVITSENLVQKSREDGTYFLNLLTEELGNLPFIANIRGVGLMLGYDLIDPKTGGHLSGETCKKIFLGCRDAGLLMMNYTPRVRIQIPLTTPRSHMAEAVDILKHVLVSIL